MVPMVGRRDIIGDTDRADPWWPNWISLPIILRGRGVLGRALREDATTSAQTGDRGRVLL